MNSDVLLRMDDSIVCDKVVWTEMGLIDRPTPRVELDLAQRLAIDPNTSKSCGWSSQKPI